MCKPNMFVEYRIYMLQDVLIVTNKYTDNILMDRYSIPRFEHICPASLEHRCDP